MRAQRLADPEEDAAHQAVVRHVQDGVLAALAVWAGYIHDQAVSSAELRPLALARWASLVQSPPAVLAEAFRSFKHNELFGRGRFAPLPLSRRGWLRPLVAQLAAGASPRPAPHSPGGRRCRSACFEQAAILLQQGAQRTARFHHMPVLVDRQVPTAGRSR